MKVSGMKRDRFFGDFWLHIEILKKEGEKVEWSKQGMDPRIVGF